MGMLKHLVAFHANTGVSITGVSFLEEACMDESTSVLFSGVVRAIQDLMGELKLGDIKTFETADNVITSVQRGVVVVTLLMARGADPAAHAGKLVDVATMIDNFIDWSTWSGEVSQFEPLNARIHQVMLTSSAESCKTANAVLRDIMGNVPGMVGFVIAGDGAVVDSHFDDTGDFELDALIQSAFVHQFLDAVRVMLGSFVSIPSLGGVLSMLVDFSKFTVALFLPRPGVECFAFIRGKVDLQAGLEPVARVLGGI